MAAFGQIFFSLSLGMGAGFTYASYTEDNIDLISSGLYVIMANCAFENFAALGVFSILGYMSLQSGTPVSEIVSQGTTLIFVVYPPSIQYSRNNWFNFRSSVFLFCLYSRNYQHTILIRGTFNFHSKQIHSFKTQGNFNINSDWRFSIDGVCDLCRRIYTWSRPICE